MLIVEFLNGTLQGKYTSPIDPIIKAKTVVDVLWLFSVAKI